MAQLRGDRRTTDADEEARYRARGNGCPVGRAGVCDVPARTEIPICRTPVGVRQGALQRTRHCARGLGGPSAGRDCELGLLRRARRLFCDIDRDLGLPQWADLGMYLQTVMLLLRAKGLHSCPQMAWSQVCKTVAEIVSPPAELILFCGMSIGYEDDKVQYVRTGRAPLDETVTFVQG